MYVQMIASEINVTACILAYPYVQQAIIPAFHDRLDTAVLPDVSDAMSWSNTHTGKTGVVTLLCCCSKIYAYSRALSTFGA